MHREAAPVGAGWALEIITVAHWTGLKTSTREDDRYRSLIREGRREESRRGTHECVRHADLRKFSWSFADRKVHHNRLGSLSYFTFITMNVMSSCWDAS
jgi:hypothetical protein